MKYRWLLADSEPSLVSNLAGSLRIPPLLGQCLLNRGFSEISSVENFLAPKLRQLADPFLLPDMPAAVERLVCARERKEPLVIFGDYDVDGVTATALLLEVFAALGWHAHSYLPHRRDEGYGLTTEAVESCLTQFPVSLLLAVDCGSSNAACIRSLRERGVDVLVLDHHQVSNPAPPALALVNPHVSRTDHPDGYPVLANSGEGAPLTELCSVGLAFKLAHALVKYGRQAAWPAATNYDLRPLLDLVALGTIADVVPLRGENRILVSAGLERLNTTRRPGLVALKQLSQCPATIGPHEVGFRLAPRLNAAGRLETAAQSLQLLRARTLAEAMPLAQNLDAQNQERQRLERAIAQQALAAVESRFKPESDFVIVEGHLNWHIGVVGIVASRILQQYYRPTIIVGGDGTQYRGSGRSIAGFDLAAALGQCGDLLLHHGGHAMAAGLSILPSNIDAFRSRFNEVARRSLQAGSLQPVLHLDAKVRLRDLTLAAIRALGRLKPTGQGNPPIQFVTCNLKHSSPPRKIGSENQHLKLWVTDGTGSHEAVWWGAANSSPPEGLFDLAYVPQENCYNGASRVQLKVLDWRPAASA